MNDAVLSAKGLSVGYTGKAVLSGIEITAERGKILTLIGPNGAGKSTLLKTLCRQLEPVGGTVFIGKDDISRMKSRDLAKNMAVLLTQKVKTQLMTCREAVETGRFPYVGALAVMGDEDRKKVDEALEMVGASEFADKDIDKLSDGQRQRVLLARAICQEPDILILDEPATFLDIRYKLELMALLKKLASERGVSIIMSLHELELAQKVSDMILCIKCDSPDRYGTPEEIFSGGYIEKLYGTEEGRFCEYYGSVELSAAEGEPEVFVIGGGGKGLGIYRQLQRKGIPFAVGVLHENDIEFPAAKSLASEVITESAFEPVSVEKVSDAMAVMDKCRYVLCSNHRFGTMNKGNADLLEKAENCGKLIKDVEDIG